MTARSDEERSGQRLILRRDHIAGGVFIAAGILVFALSDDLPFGTLASPGAGMMPKLVLGLMVLFGATLVLRANESPPFAALEWGDLGHAITVVSVAAATAVLYTRIGFILSTALLLFVLLFLIERRKLWRAAAVSIGVTVAAYYLFNTLLKAPLPAMPFWF